VVPPYLTITRARSFRMGAQWSARGTRVRVLPPGNGRGTGHAYRLPRGAAGSSGGSSGMIFGFRASSGRTNPGLSAHARQAYSFRLRL